MTSILITGGTGAFGRAFTEYLLGTSDYDRIIIFSRNEWQQHLMKEQFIKHEKRLRFFIGDVRDQPRLRRAMQDVEMVIHAAALKRIEVGHYNPIEMVKTNVDGAINVIEAAHDAKVRRVVTLSSDKAYRPVSPYGFSKAMAESLFIAANNIRGWSGPQFAVCRYGNVWKSTGSVVPLWRQILHNGGGRSVPVTDPDCTRFFMRMDQAIALVRECMDYDCPTDQIKIPVLPAYRLGDLAAASCAEMTITGLPPWAKKHESMSDHDSSETARRMTIDELRAEL